MNIPRIVVAGTHSGVLEDPTLPPGLDGLYLGGGYPELHAAALSANESMRAAILESAADGPVYAECVGGMYLMQAIVDCERARGHEFRYSTMDPMPETICGIYRDPAEGYRVRSAVGSYLHLRFLSNPQFAKRFVRDCARRRAIN